MRLILVLLCLLVPPGIAIAQLQTETIILNANVYEFDTGQQWDCSDANLTLHQQGKCARYTLILTVDDTGNIVSITDLTGAPSASTQLQ